MLMSWQKNQYIHDLEKITSMGTIRAEFNQLSQIVRKFPYGPTKELYGVVQRLQSYADQSIERYWKQLQADPENVKPTLLTKEYAGVEEGWITKEQIQRDAQGNIVAGTDTTAITASYTIWLLSHHPEVEQALIEEVSTLPVDFMDHELRGLPLLNNVLNETLRLKGPILQGLPRYVPIGGADFCDYYIPGGNVVGIQAYTMHRNPNVWTNPEIFDPSRWDDPSKDMRDSFVPFGGGSRSKYIFYKRCRIESLRSRVVCVGMHFAQLELRHAIVNFYRTFASGVRKSHAEGFSDLDMLPISYFLSPPKGTRCLMERRK